MSKIKKMIEDKLAKIDVATEHIKEDMVHHPSHWQCEKPEYEPYKVIAAWELNFNIGNAVKYLARYKKKWNAIEDLEKAKQYIDFEIERLTSDK